MKTIAFIFARGGSKGLPGKNIRLFRGKPLIAWAISQALSVDRIQEVIVSTDSEEIAEIARAFGAKTPFIRPKALSGDETPEWAAWQHAINFYYHNEKEMPRTFVSLPATAPLRLKIDIERCLDKYEQGDCDAVIAVTKAHRNPYFNMVKENFDGTVSLVIESDKNITRRQDAPMIFDITTICYVANPHFIMTNNSIFDGKIRAVNIAAANSIDIDELLDFQIAESIMDIRDKKNE